MEWLEWDDPEVASMRFSCPRVFLMFVFLISCAVFLSVRSARAQTVHVDVSAGKAISFDPDKAMGTSMDILPAKGFDTVFSGPVMKAGLSAGWGPITYRQNTELTYDAWHWNPNGTWSDAKHKSGYFVGSAEPTGFLRESYGYRLVHRGTTRSDSGQDEYLADDGRRCGDLLEEQSLFDEQVYRAAGFGASAVGGDGLCDAAAD
jgi:hypothetical protein